MHCLTVCVDRTPLLRLVFCCLLTACDYSAISPCTTTVRLHEPSLRHVRRLHVMLTTELQSVQPTIMLPSPDAARQCHLHSEAEDDIVRKLIQLLAKFDVLSTVRDAMRIVEELASGGDRMATASEFRRLRDYVLIEVARSNGQRSGVVLQMTVDEFHRSSAVRGHRVVHVACH